MGIDRTFGGAFAKALTAAGQKLPVAGKGLHLRLESRQAGRRAHSAGLRGSRVRDLRSEGTAEVLKNNGLR
jgi:carbamoyl-phosphate synthase large subunit